ncbi:hypothetical protein [Romboutsia sp.]|uniref:hypothetical protein n=1 Tax=Romboutsia sp. TaxID=1965302 RepID=UPI002B88945F|nr:hypothetical protein [Romboutsia sp.]HSQ88724.1 hypothetical protein [Romboutsia sp.]
MYNNIYGTKGNELIDLLYNVWEQVISERTPFQKYFIKRMEDYHNINMNRMLTEDEEWVQLWEIRKLETIKFYKYLGFEIDSFVYDSKGNKYYVAYAFGTMKNKKCIDSVSLKMRKVDKYFKKEETNCFNVFSAYFDTGRVLNGTNETNFADFYITNNFKIDTEKKKLGNLEVEQFKWII